MQYKKDMQTAGYLPNKKIANTLQGCIWRAVQKLTNKKVVIKRTNVNLWEKSMISVNGIECKVDENILMEKAILQYLSNDKKCPDSIVKYIDAFKSNDHFYLVMEDGGFNLLEFVVKIHNFIANEQLDIAEWHKLAKIIFKQMIECIEYIHSKQVCHFDISLENFLINDIHIEYSHKENKIKFCIDDDDAVQIKLADFGLSHLFSNESDSKPNFLSNKYCGKIRYQSPEITNKKKLFSAQSNDIWCLGTCLFMMIIGSSPWNKTSNSDQAFVYIMTGKMEYLLSQWNKLEYINKELLELFRMFFQYEDKRINVEKLKKYEWVN